MLFATSLAPRMLQGQLTANLTMIRSRNDSQTHFRKGFSFSEGETPFSSEGQLEVTWFTEQVKGALPWHTSSGLGNHGRRHPKSKADLPSSFGGLTPTCLCPAELASSYLVSIVPVILSAGASGYLAGKQRVVVMFPRVWRLRDGSNSMDSITYLPYGTRRAVSLKAMIPSRNLEQKIFKSHELWLVIS